MNTRLSDTGGWSARHWAAEFVASLLARAHDRIAPFAARNPISSEPRQALEASETDSCKSVLLTHMTQELRTPFQGVLGMLSLIEETRLDAAQRDYVQTARDAAQQLLSMLNDMLDVSTMASGTLRLAPEPTRLRTLMQEVESLLRASAYEKGLKLEVDVASDLPEWVMADAARVRQILVVLLGNAVKFTRKGSITARLSRLEDTPGGVCLTVQDTGMGMDSATIAQLFIRICQSDTSGLRSVGTSRMGLTVLHNLATMMGGGMRVSSEPGQGSLFTVHMILPNTHAPAEVLHEVLADNRSPRLRVLVAEDDLINLKYMNLLLDRMGHEAVFCENGQEALQLLELQRFDVVLLDYHMPELDGLATTRAIRTLQGPNKDIKVVLVTADVLNDTRNKALEAGVSEFASKPLQAPDLQRALRRSGLLDTSATLAADISAKQATSWLEPEAMETNPMSLIDAESYSDLAASMPPDAMDVLIEQLFKRPHGSVHALLASLTAGDAPRIASDASELLSMASRLGFRALMRTGQQIECMAQEANPSLREELVTQLLSDAIGTQIALQELGTTTPTPFTHVA